MDAKTKSSLPKPLIYLPESFHTVRFRKKEGAAEGAADSFAAALAAGSNRYSSGLVTAMPCFSSSGLVSTIGLVSTMTCHSTD
jgi:hypothetical protein